MDLSETWGHKTNVIYPLLCILRWQWEVPPRCWPTTARSSGQGAQNTSHACSLSTELRTLTSVPHKRSQEGNASLVVFHQPQPLLSYYRACFTQITAFLKGPVKIKIVSKASERAVLQGDLLRDLNSCPAPTADLWVGKFKRAEQWRCQGHGAAVTVLENTKKGLGFFLKEHKMEGACERPSWSAWNEPWLIPL